MSKIESPSDNSELCYVQIKLSKIKNKATGSKDKFLIQIIDVSQKMLYNEFEAEK